MSPSLAAFFHMKDAAAQVLVGCAVNPLSEMRLLKNDSQMTVLIDSWSSTRNVLFVKYESFVCPVKVL